MPGDATTIERPTTEEPARPSQALARRPAVGATLARAWPLPLAAGGLLAAAYLLWPGRPPQVLLVAAALVAGAAVAAGIRSHRPRPRRPWLLIAAGLGVIAVGEVAWTVWIDLKGSDGVRFSGAEFFYLAGYLLLAAGFLLVTRPVGEPDLPALIDAAIVAVAVGVVAWVFLISPFSAAPDLSPLERGVVVAFPLVDLLIVAAGLRAALAPVRRWPSRRLLALGLAFLLATDLAYAISLLAGGYRIGAPLDAGWFLFYGAVGAAGLHPSMAAPPPAPAEPARLGPARLALLAAASLLAPATLAIQAVRGQPLDVPVIVAGSALLGLLVLVRLLGVADAHRRAVERERILRTAGERLTRAADRSDVLVATRLAAAELAGGAAVRVVGSDLPHPAGATVVPLPVTRAEPGAIVVDRPQLPAAVARGLAAIAAQAALALDRDVLAEDLHRRRSELRFRSLVRNASDMIIVVDAQGLTRYVSPAVERMLGYRPEERIGRPATELIHPDDRDRVAAFQRELAARPGANLSLEYRARHRDGSWRTLDAVGANLLADPTVAGMVVTSRDVTDRKEAEARLAYQAFHDPLTGLPNRTLFLDRLDHALTRAGRDGDQVAVLFLDLDRFKLVNDSLGHEQGDRLLVEVGERLRGAVGPAETVARFGGDEFTILLEATSEAAAVAAAAAVRRAFAGPIRLNGQTLYVAPSIGVALAPPGDRHPSDLLRNADTAMFRAKTLGEPGYAVFQPAMGTAVADRLELETDLRAAIAGRQFHLAYQPEVDLATGRVVSLEALVRWQHPTRGPILPTQFVPLAEETGLILPLGRWVLETACRQGQRWRADLPHDPPAVSVNLSARQLRQPAIVAEVAAALAASGLPPAALTLEMTETAAIADLDQSAATLAGLEQLGVRLAIDDFGTGYSGLEYVSRLPVDKLKVDRSFVTGLGHRPADAVIVGAITAMARALDLPVTAEGVGTAEQPTRLRALGCELGQGYLFGRPLPAPEATAAIARRPAATTVGVTP